MAIEIIRKYCLVEKPSILLLKRWIMAHYPIGKSPEKATGQGDTYILIKIPGIDSIDAVAELELFLKEKYG